MNLNNSTKMYKIHRFVFTWKDEVREYPTPQSAITAFEQRGWGMQNWKIKIKFKGINAVHDTESTIDLAMFNYLTDNWFDIQLAEYNKEMEHGT